MRNAFIIALLLSLAGVAVFGFLGMGHAGCIAATAQGLATGCLADERPLGEAGFHIAVYKTFSLALANGMALAALLAVAYIVLSRHSKRTEESRPHFLGIFQLLFSFRLTNLWRKTAHWLALHEARDPLCTVRGA